MTRKQIVVWILFLVLVISALAACDGSGAAVGVAPEVTIQQLSEPALKPLTVSAAGNDEPTRSVNLPVVLSDEKGEEPPTATSTFSTPIPSVTPTPLATNDGSATLTPTNMPSTTPTITASDTPQGSATATVSVTNTNTPQPGTTNTPTPTAINGPSPTPTVTGSASATPTNTPQSGATNTPTPTATNGPSPTPTVTGSAQHFTNCAFRTGGNAVIAFTSEVVISGGLTFDIGDEIAVFTPDGKICAGVQLKDKPNIAVTAWGDDSQTPEVDGLRAGETMFYRIWDTSAGIEYKVTSTTYAVGPGLGSGKYSADSIHSLTAITVSSS